MGSSHRTHTLLASAGRTVVRRSQGVAGHSAWKLPAGLPTCLRGPRMAAGQRRRRDGAMRGRARQPLTARRTWAHGWGLPVRSAATVSLVTHRPQYDPSSPLKNFRPSRAVVRVDIVNLLNKSKSEEHMPAAPPSPSLRSSHTQRHIPPGYRSSPPWRRPWSTGSTGNSRPPGPASRCHGRLVRVAPL